MQELPIQTLQEQMAAGALSAAALVERYLQRIAQIDKQGPALNAVIELNPDATDIARLLDQERQKIGVRGPLHGIPILIKDNIDTGDRMTTTAGSLALEGHQAESDAFLVAKLRQAGAIILGKTNLSEWANFRSTRSSSGWSSRGGQTKNPYALDRNPCGSSSGSAVAVAANLCAAAVGTETDGSIICPSQVNGIVGIKPTVGLISRSGIVPISQTQDTAGPMARSVADAAVLLGAMVGVDANDPATAMAHLHDATDYTAVLDLDGLRGARLGVARSFMGSDAKIDALMERSFDLMRHLGAAIVDPANIETAVQLRESEAVLLEYEFKAGLNRYLETHSTALQSLDDVILFNDANAERVMPYFGQERMLRAQARGALSDAAYLEAREAARRLSRDEGIDATLRRYRLDAIVAPSGGPAWLTDWANGDCYRWQSSSSPAAVSGYPSITVPAGYLFGLPVGLSFIGTAYSESTLIKLAYAFEQATQVRQAPSFPPTISLRE